MKALLILEIEMFIKKKQYIFPLLYIVYSICSLVYTVKVKASNENILIVILSIQLICEFAKREQPMKRIVRLFPVSAKERINTLFVETFILNVIVLAGLSISFFPFHGMGMLWGILNMVVFVETLEIPAILSVVMWHRNYFQHLLMMLIVIGMSVLVYIKKDIHPIIQFFGYATVLYTLAYISSIRILTNKDW